MAQTAEPGPKAAPAPPGVTPYDEVPYQSSSFPQTHPDRLATLGTLFGLTPAPVETCRVLEVGCGQGWNLIAMASCLPEAEFLGVDLSARQVDAGRRAVEALVLENIRLRHSSLTEVDESWGEFDYILCHGVYSWVSEDVQDKILGIAESNLARQGIAYVSYNTYPGWHIREMVRHMMRYHGDQFDEAEERIEQARALIQFLAGAVDTTTYYGALLKEELELVNRVGDSYLFHEHLEEVNKPLYFHEFVDRAERRNLQYLADAEFSTMLASSFPEPTAETLERIGPDIVRTEQYMDFLRNRFFRQTLLCRSNLELERELEGEDLRGLLVASPLAPDENPGGNAGSFSMPDGRRVETTFPLTREVLRELYERWPAALDQETLRRGAAERLARAGGTTDEEAWAVVRHDLLHCFSRGTVELHTWQAPFETEVSSTPRVSPLAARQAESEPWVTNRRHEPIVLDPVARFLVKLLDGGRDRASLLVELEGAVARRELTIERDGRPVTERESTSRILEDALDQTLRRLADRALLVG